MPRNDLARTPGCGRQAGRRRCDDATTFERFTEPARRVLVLAQEEARILGHGYIGTEHILLGLARLDGGVAVTALQRFGVGLDGVRERLQEAAGERDAQPSPPFTPRARKVLELSLREALSLGEREIRPEHLLLGVVREGEGLGAQILVGLGVDLARLRREVIHLTTGAPAPAPEDVADSTRPVRVCSMCARDIWESGHFVSAGAVVVCEVCVSDAHAAMEAAPATQQEVFLPPRVFGTEPDSGSLGDILVRITLAFDSEADPRELALAVEDFDELQPFWVLAATHFPRSSITALERVRFIDDYHAAVQFRTIAAFGASVSRHALFVRSDNGWCMSAASMREALRGLGIAVPR